MENFYINTRWQIIPTNLKLLIGEDACFMEKTVPEEAEERFRDFWEPWELENPPNHQALESLERKDRNSNWFGKQLDSLQSVGTM